MRAGQEIAPRGSSKWAASAADGRAARRAGGHRQSCHHSPARAIVIKKTAIGNKHSTHQGAAHFGLMLQNIRHKGEKQLISRVRAEGREASSAHQARPATVSYLQWHARAVNIADVARNAAIAIRHAWQKGAK